MKATQNQDTHLTEDRESDEQEALLKAMSGTLYHYFGGWQDLFKGVRDGRNSEMIRYPLVGY